MQKKMLIRCDLVVGIDNLDDYHDREPKHVRLAQLSSNANFRLRRMDVASRPSMGSLFASSLLLPRGVGAYVDWSLAYHNRQRGFCQ